MNKEGSPNLEKNGDKNRKTTSQEKNESSGVSNFFGTLGDFFKTNVSSTQTTENRSVSSGTNKDEVKSSPNPTKPTIQDFGNFPAAPVSSKGKVRVRSLSKQTTIDDTGLKEPSTKDIQGNNLFDKEVPSRDHLIQQSPNPSFTTNCFKVSSRESSIETSGVSTVTEDSGSNKISFDILSRKNSNEQDHFSDKDLSFSTVTISPPQPELPTRKSIFSFLTGSGKSENKASATLPRTKSKAEELFTLPSFFPTNSSIKKDASHNSSFSFFSLSFLDEKQQTPGEKHSLSTIAPVTSQPCKKPSVFVDMSGTVNEGSNGNRGSIVQELIHEQQMAPCVSISNTVEVTFLDDELNVGENYQGKLGSRSWISLADFQLNQLQTDIAPHSPGYQAQTETLLIGPETFEVASHEGDFIQEAFLSGSLAKSFPHDSHLIGKLNNLDTCTNHHQDERFSGPVEILTQNLEPTSSSEEPGCAGHLQSRDTDKEEDKSLLGSSVEMLSGFVNKVKSFSESLIEPPKTFSGFFSSSKPPKKSSFFSLASGASSPPLKGELFGIFKSPIPDTCKQESSIPTTAWLQNDSSRDAVGSVPPENLWREAASTSFNSESALNDYRMTVLRAKSDSETLTNGPSLTTKVGNSNIPDHTLTDDLKLMTEMENSIPDNIPEPQSSETIGATSSISGDDTGQGVLSLSDEGDMGVLQDTDTETSFEAEHISLPTQSHPDPTWIAKDLPSPIQPLLPLEPKPAMRSAFTKQNILELQATNSLETSTTTLFSEASSVGQNATLETQGSLSHPLWEEPVLCAKESYGIFDAQKDPPAALQETEQPRPRFEIPNMTNWPKLHFPSSAAYYGKPLSSFFSPPSSSGNRGAETSLMSGFKKLSTLFEGEHKGDPEQMPTESFTPILIVSSDQDLNSSEADKASESSQMSGASAHPAKGLEKWKIQQEIPASGEDWNTKGYLSGLTSPSGSHEEEHCTVSELLHQPETQGGEAVPASSDSVLNGQLPVTPHGIKETKTNERPVLN
ncbi:hypothetical protein QTO34_005353 [Cnephaeus nilssonii]|uniref:Uncharacterized protein n=1 Tax=Cnephaeus nilssonii TaxID=3371016 RepID=A0AA40LJV0_CNENI|nr:hypothetical protein QTO34_005353 [Eptesicus nilssonii]